MYSFVFTTNFATLLQSCHPAIPLYSFSSRVHKFENIHGAFEHTKSFNDVDVIETLSAHAVNSTEKSIDVYYFAEHPWIDERWNVIQNV